MDKDSTFAKLNLSSCPLGNYKEIIIIVLDYNNLLYMIKLIVLYSKLEGIIKQHWFPTELENNRAPFLLGSRG